MNISWLMMSGERTATMSRTWELQRERRDLKSRYGGVDQFSQRSEDASLREGGGSVWWWGGEAPETTVYLKVNLCTLLQ